MKDYKIPGTDVTIEKGTSIMIPPYALHHDEKFYPNPHEFDPSRFADENNTGRPYLAFGNGPRACIGQRIAKLFIKIGVCAVLQHYQIELDDRHIGKEIKLSSDMQPIGSIHLKLKTKQF